MVLSNGLDLLEYRVDDAGRHRDKFLVVVEYVVVAIAFVGSCDLAHSVQRSSHIGQIPNVLDAAVFAAQEGRTFAISFYCFSLLYCTSPCQLHYLKKHFLVVFFYSTGITVVMFSNLPIK